MLRKKFIALIPCKYNSVRLKNKNLRNFHKTPLFLWTVKQALESKYIDEVYVSTDSKMIRDLAIMNGAKSNGLRTKTLSQSNTLLDLVILYEIEKLKKKNISSECIVLLQPTSPLRLPGSIDRAIEQILFEKSDSLLSVINHTNFIWTYNKKINNKNYDKFHPSYDFKLRPRTQDLKGNYVETGSIYISKTNLIKKNQARLSGKISLYQTPDIEKFEIDTLLDFRLCEFLFKNMHYLSGNNYVKK